MLWICGVASAGIWWSGVWSSPFWAEWFGRVRSRCRRGVVGVGNQLPPHAEVAALAQSAARRLV